MNRRGVVVPLRRLDRLDRLPVFERLRAELLIDPFEEVPVGRHTDADGDGYADQTPEPDELAPDEHDACACEPGHIGDAGAYDGDDAPEVPAW